MIGLEIDTGLGMPKNLSTSPIHKNNNLTETCSLKSIIFSDFLIMSHHDTSMNEGGNGGGGMGGYDSPLHFGGDGGTRGSSTPVRPGYVPNEDLDASMVSIFDGAGAGAEKSRKRSGDKAGSSEKLTVIEEDEEANSSKNSGRSTYSVPGTGASASASGTRRSTAGSLNNSRAGETEEERHLRMQALASQLEAARTASATNNGSGGNGNLGSGNAGARKTPPLPPKKELK